MLAADVRAASSRQAVASVRSQGVCFVCVIQTRPNPTTYQEATPQRSEGQTHTHKYRDTTQRLTFRRFRRIRVPEMSDIS